VRRLAFFLLLLAAGLMGFTAGALSVQDSPATVSYDFATPAPSSTSLAYGLGYEVILQVVTGNYTIANYTASIGAGPSVGAVSAAYSLGVGLAADSYQAGTVAPGDPATVVVPPPATYTTTITNTTTEYITQTITVTRTITESGTTQVITEIQTVTIPVEQESRLDPATLGFGLFLILLVGLALLRR